MAFRIVKKYLNLKNLNLDKIIIYFTIEIQLHVRFKLNILEIHVVFIIFQNINGHINIRFCKINFKEFLISYFLI